MSDGGSPQPNQRPRSPYPEMTPVYSPGVFHRNDAKIFHVGRDDQITGADLTVNTAGLHTVKGRVVAGEDRHVPSKGFLRLREDGSEDVGRFAGVEDDGSFQFDYLPSGQYTLELLGAADQLPAADSLSLPQESTKFKMQKEAVTIGNKDVVLEPIELIALKPGEQVESPAW